MGDGSGKGKGYLEHHTGLRNYPVPKGLLGYDGKTPNFSTKEMVTLWLLQLMTDGQPWYGKALIEEIRRRTRCEGFDGYAPSNGVVFGLLRQWSDAGIVSPCEHQLDHSPGRRPLRYVISDEGRISLGLMKELHRSQIAAGAHVFSRLWHDLYDIPALRSDPSDSHRTVSTTSASAVEGAETNEDPAEASR